MKQVAALVGVDASTVSLALREDPRISARTRRRVREAAEAMGYCPNPLIAALNAARRQRRIAGHQANLAFVGFYEERDRMEKDPFQRGLFQGAAEMARENGFSMDFLWFREPGMTVERFKQILKSRGIHGVILSPLDHPQERYPLEWGPFAVVGIGLSAPEARVSRVVHDNYRGMLLLLERLGAIRGTVCGLCIDDESDQRTMGMWTAAYLWYRRRHPGRCAPPLILRGFTPSRFARWMKVGGSP